MTIQADIKTALSTVFSNRFWPIRAPENNTARTYGTYQLISTNPSTYFRGEGINNWRYQVDIFAPDPATAASLAASVRAAMAAATVFRSVCVDQRDLEEEFVNLYRISLDFSVWQ